jgi:hypothetical protein
MSISADDLYRFILENAEEREGQMICRVPTGPWLRTKQTRGNRRLARAKLIKELEERGLVTRPHPQSGWVIVNDPPSSAASANVQFRHDAQATRQRHRRLQSYMRRNVLNGKQFICSSWDEFESSIRADCTFKEGQLSHIGKHYDLTLAARPLRIVVVGQEVGAKGKARTTLAERYANVHGGSGMNKRFVKDGKHPSRNPHMKGTTLALRTILGTGSGIERKGEFINVDGEQVHLFDCFALVNRLLCAAHLTGTSTGMSTKTMLRNCQRHFQATLEILEPTVVVLQGVRMWKWSKNVLVPKRTLSDNLIECSLGGKTTLVAAFSHPSSYGKKPIRWDSPDAPYFKDVVYPTLRQAVPL